MKQAAVLLVLPTVLIFISVLASGCWDARAGGAEEPRQEPDIITLDVREIVVPLPKPAVHIVVPKMKTKYEPIEREEGFVQEILHGPLPPVPDADPEEPRAGKGD